jgi:hypothetical protein
MCLLKGNRVPKFPDVREIAREIEAVRLAKSEGSLQKLVSNFAQNPTDERTRGGSARITRHLIRRIISLALAGSCFLMSAYLPRGASATWSII